ncbi:hypothetical protein EVAR_55761_1 [Eumeta japonica]|uniref:Uncharacterized protein n=1 Tax=Eumeta variegata TaxID=151549 RepID=A0A4C1XA46_EUMVA|nr:hypothetical protein EVAR_55761_1 [Eumeta japonica]
MRAAEQKWAAARFCSTDIKEGSQRRALPGAGAGLGPCWATPGYGRPLLSSWPVAPPLLAPTLVPARPSPPPAATAPKVHSTSPGCVARPRRVLTIVGVAESEAHGASPDCTVRHRRALTIVSAAEPKV